MLNKRNFVITLLFSILYVDAIFAGVTDVTKSEAELKTHINSGKPVVVKFYWKDCGPCKSIAPTYEKLSNEHPNVVFLKSEADCGYHQNYGIGGYPTFVFYKGGKKVYEFSGGRPDKLNEEVERLSTGKAVEKPMTHDEEEMPAPKVKKPRKRRAAEMAPEMEEPMERPAKKMRKMNGAKMNGGEMGEMPEKKKRGRRPKVKECSQDDMN